MSQSDYIKYKQVSSILKTDNTTNNNKLQPVLTSQDYINYKQYAIETTVPNSKIINNQLLPTGKQIIFDMEKTVTNCPQFILCKNTSGHGGRPNRIPMSTIYFTPTPMPLTIKQLKNSDNLCTAYNCALNSKHTNDNLCRCRTRSFGIVR